MKTSLRLQTLTVEHFLFWGGGGGGTIHPVGVHHIKN